jgi:choline dehydrogenase-like flavoprotein
MGADASASVVAPSGESHEVHGLYVADASLFPTAVGVNPMITIMAFARRVAAGLAERLA